MEQKKTLSEIEIKRDEISPKMKKHLDSEIHKNCTYIKDKDGKTLSILIPSPIMSVEGKQIYNSLLESAGMEKLLKEKYNLKNNQILEIELKDNTDVELGFNFDPDVHGLFFVDNSDELRVKLDKSFDALKSGESSVINFFLIGDKTKRTIHSESIVVAKDKTGKRYAIVFSNFFDLGIVEYKDKKAYTNDFKANIFYRKEHDKNILVDRNFIYLGAKAISPVAEQVSCQTFSLIVNTEMDNETVQKFITNPQDPSVVNKIAKYYQTTKCKNLQDFKDKPVPSENKEQEINLEEYKKQYNIPVYKLKRGSQGIPKEMYKRSDFEDTTVEINAKLQIRSLEDLYWLTVRSANEEKERTLKRIEDSLLSLGYRDIDKLKKECNLNFKLDLIDNNKKEENLLVAIEKLRNELNLTKEEIKYIFDKAQKWGGFSSRVVPRYNNSNKYFRQECYNEFLKDFKDEKTRSYMINFSVEFQKKMKEVELMSPINKNIGLRTKRVVIGLENRDLSIQRVDE